MMLKTLALAVAMTGAAAGLALAEDAAPGDAPLAMTYDVFEMVVPHIDLPECPEAVARDGTFCRLTLAEDELNLVVFSEEGDMPMIDYRQVDLENTAFSF